MATEVICIGELLIDFICTDIDTDLAAGNQFLKKAGGAPANVAATITKLGGTAAFAGKVGADPFGDFLEKELLDAAVDTSMLVKDDTKSTTLAFVSLQANGERDFVFNRGADQDFQASDLDWDQLEEAKVVHFGSATALLSDPFQSTYFKAMKIAKEKGLFISFDPNFRGNLWKDRMNDFIQLSKKSMTFADFVKVSEEEMELITGEVNRTNAVQTLHDLGAKIVAVTLGREGTLISDGQKSTIVPSIAIESVDSTGAGDAFVGATLFQLANEADAPVHFERLTEIVTFSNKVGALVCTKLGAISALPTREEVENY